jgi:hypothetical protein
MPARRSEVSGLSNAVAAKRFAALGKAAKKSPSITSTSPIATMNWAMLRCRAGLPRYYFGGVIGAALPPVEGAPSRGLPDGSEKYRKKSESGVSNMRVSLARSPFS